MTSNRTHAIFLDFDGVLVDSTTIKTDAFRHLYQSYGQTVVNQVVAHHQLHGGISRVEKIQYIHSQVLNNPLTEKEVAVWAANYSKLVVGQVVACPWVAGAKRFLEQMRSVVPMFLISATPQEELIEIVHRRGMGAYFQSIHGSPIRKPEHIRRLLMNHRLEPSRCLFVGDAMTDYLAAKETGVPFIGIENEMPLPKDALTLPDCVCLADWVEV